MIENFNDVSGSMPEKNLLKFSFRLSSSDVFDIECRINNEVSRPIFIEKEDAAAAAIRVNSRLISPSLLKKTVVRLIESRKAPFDAKEYVLRTLLPRLRMDKIIRIFFKAAPVQKRTGADFLAIAGQGNNRITLRFRAVSAAMEPETYEEAVPSVIVPEYMEYAEFKSKMIELIRMAKHSAAVHA